MPLDEQLNCVVRFAFFFTVITFVMKRDPNIFLVLFAAMFVTIAMYHVDKTQKSQLASGGGSYPTATIMQQQQGCRVPTKDNPFMNPIYGVNTNNESQKTACDVTQLSTRKKVQESFDKTLMRNVDDLWRKQSSDRQFYTIPCTDVCSDQKGFAHWLYGTVGSQKNPTLPTTPSAIATPPQRNNEEPSNDKEADV